MSTPTSSDSTMPTGDGSGTSDVGNPDVTGFQPDPTSDGQGDPAAQGDPGVEAGAQPDVQADPERADDEMAASERDEAGDDRRFEAAESGSRSADQLAADDAADGDDAAFEQLETRQARADDRSDDDALTWDDIKSDYQVAPEDAPQEPLG